MNKPFLANLLQVTTQSSDIEAFCRNTIHNLWPTLTYNSAQFYKVSTDGMLERTAGYFIDSQNNDEARIPFHSDHPAAVAAKNGQACMDSKKHKRLALPIRSAGWLQGILVLEPISSDAYKVDDFETEILADALGAFLGALLSTRRNRGEQATTKPDQLTARQIQILRGMNEGLIYAQIASNLHVSESLVKLEVTRIFRFFGVSGRAAAIRAGKDLLESTTPPPRTSGLRELVEAY